MIPLLIIIIVIVIGLSAFLLRKYIPGLKSNDVPSKKEIAEENVRNMVVDPENDIAYQEEQEALRRSEIKKIKRQSKTEEEENELLANSEIIDEDDDSEIETK